MTIQTVVTVFTGGIHCARFGTKCLPEMILIAKIKRLLVNKKTWKTVERECQHF